VASLLRFALGCTMTGSAESKYFAFVNICATPWFLAGVLLVLVASRLRITFVAHAVALAVLMSTGKATGWPISFVMGYALTGMFIAATRQGTLGYALSALVATGIWIFGLMAYTLSGLIVEHKMGLTFAEGLAADLRVVAVVFYGLWLLLAALNVWRSRTRHAPEAASVPPSTSLPQGWAYAAVWGAILLPVGLLIATAMGHLIGFERAPRIEVGEPAGICHAGYSRSDEDYALLNKLGAKYTRIPFYWGQIQPDPDTWKFEELDAFLDAAEKHNVKVVGVLGFDNDRVEQAAEEVKRLCSVAPEDMPLFLEFVRRTVDHYKDRVYAWEIWNEPDLHLFWTGTMDEFYPLARSAAATIREVHPEARILGTAMTSLLGARSAAGIEGLHATGALAQVDHPSMHTYVSDPRAYYNEFLRVKNAAAKYGHPGPIWITEVGDPDGGVYPWRASSGLLAEHAMKAHVIATSLGIETVLWHVFKDGSLENLRKEPWNSEGFFGLVKDNDQWKPAAHAYALFSHHCSNSVIRSDLVGVTGGIAACQIRTALYRRDDGESALVLWFEPGLRQGAHARVTFDLGALEEPALMRDITSSYSKYLVDGLADVTEQPLFITYRSPSPDTPVRLTVETSPADGAWLLLAIVLVVWAAWASMRQRPAT
jgi:Glycosyl hydrolases family 39